MTQGTLEFPEREHAHLRLARQLPAGTRVARPSRYARAVNYPDQRGHGAKLRRELAQLRAIHAKRTSVLGVDPENVAVLRFNSPPDDRALSAAGLTVLEWFTDRVVVTSPGDPQLGGLAERLEQYQAGPRAPESAVDSVSEPDGAGTSEDRPGTARYQALFDLIDEVRALSPDEIVTADVLALIEASARDAVLLLDVQCWCPEDEADARQRHEATAAAVEAGEGRVMDRSLRHRSGLSLLRIEGSPDLARELALVPHVRRIDRIPRPLVSHLEAHAGGAELLPPVLSPDRDAPLIAVVDSGVRSGHPLIGPAFAGAEASEGLDGATDGSGHGTFVASLALHGSLETLIEHNRTPVTPAGRLLSVRVLDDRNEFPDTELWENELLGAMAMAVGRGARIINLSLGDSRRPYVPDRPTPLAAAIDEFARVNDVVVVISAGNMAPEQHVLADGDFDYTTRLLDQGDAGLLDPATSALALTVGALGADEGQGLREARSLVDVVPIGGPGLPSPLTRAGLGAVNMIKPELAAPGGHAVRTGLGAQLREAPSTGVLGADGVHPGRVLAVGAGTSYATPLVTHAAARVLAANPALSARAVRALVLSSVRPVDSFLVPEGAQARARERRLVGYGRPDARRAAHSTDHRAVLVAEESILVDDVHLYSVPIPHSFFESGGMRRLSIGLAYDPTTRSTRLSYLSTRMQVQVYRGASVDDVADAYLAERQAPPEPGEASTDGAPDDQVVSGPPSLGRFKLDLQPADRDRSRGAHVFGTIKHQIRLRPDDGAEYVIAVQNVNRWEATGVTQPYALAVVLERDRGHEPIYAELQAAVQVEVRVEV